MGEEVVACASTVLQTMAALGPTVPATVPANSTATSSAARGARGDSLSSGDSSSSGSSGSSRSGREGGAADPLLPPLLLSPWDAIAALTLLGDPQEALALVSLKQWYQR